MKRCPPLLTLAVMLMALAAPVSAQAGQDTRRGQMMQVKPNSIWFQDRALFARWQQLRHSGDTAAAKSFEDDKLKSRDAWQFIYPLKVRVTRYDATTKQADVEMTSPGRMQGSKWILDADALEASPR